MTRLAPLSALALVIAELAAAPVHASTASHHRAVARRVAAMVDEDRIITAAGHYGLGVVNVMWEDTGRYLGSSVGPNISDVTIEVGVETRRGLETYLMPVVRYDNFADKTGDVDIDKFFVKVGNQREGGTLETITLRQLLAEPALYMSSPEVGTIKGGTLLAKRDKHVLVSAQSAMLPIPEEGSARFWPVIFNYQSYKKHPAVLTILVTRQGTSMTVIDNNRDTVGADSWGQRLYVNAGGQRAPLTAERLADVQAHGQTQNGESADSLGDDANLLMIIQVPLKQRQQPRRYAPSAKSASAGYGGIAMDGAEATRGDANFDVAVLGHGATEGPYTELDGLTIERDPRFPVRVTVQFYQATSSGRVPRSAVRTMAHQIRKVYKQADYVGSLVVDGVARPTLWTGATAQPADLTMAAFPGLVERSMRFGASGIDFYRRAWVRW